MPDIRETLTQLDRRLADLKQQINDLVTEPEPAAPPPPPERNSVSLPTAAELAGGAHAAPSGPAPGAPDARAAQLTVAAEAVGQVGEQLKQLLTMRDRLLDDAQQMLAGYQRELRKLEEFDPSEVEDALAALATPREAQEPAVAGPETPTRPAFFDGTTTITVVGAHRIQLIQVVEDALSRVRNVQRVYIRRWQAGQLSLELTLSAGVELIGELNRVLPFPFAVQSATGREIVITLEGAR